MPGLGFLHQHHPDDFDIQAQLFLKLAADSLGRVFIGADPSAGQAPGDLGMKDVFNEQNLTAFVPQNAYHPDGIAALEAAIDIVGSFDEPGKALDEANEGLLQARRDVGHANSLDAARCSVNCEAQATGVSRPQTHESAAHTASATCGTAAATAGVRPIDQSTLLGWMPKISMCGGKTPRASPSERASARPA